MLDWTTSFLSDETIIKLRWKSVKHFLRDYNIHGWGGERYTTCRSTAEKCPAFLRGIDENPKATLVPEEINPTENQESNWCSSINYFIIQGSLPPEILFLEDGAFPALQESVELGLQ